MKKSKTLLKSYFENGDKPTQNHYANLIDSFRHLDDKITIADIELDIALQTELDNALSNVAYNNINNTFTSDQNFSGKINLNGTTSYIHDYDGEILSGSDSGGYYLFTGAGVDIAKPIYIGDNASFIRFKTSDTERYRIDGSGNHDFGTGTATFGNNITLNQTTGGTSAYINIESASYGGIRLATDANGARVQSLDANEPIYFQIGNDVYYEILSDGNHDFKSGTATFGSRANINSVSFASHLRLIRNENSFDNTWDVTLAGGGSSNNLTFTAENATGYDFSTRLHISANKSIYGQNDNEWDLGTATERFKNIYASNFIGDGSQLTGINAGNLPDNIVYRDANNSFTTSQTFNGKIFMNTASDELMDLQSNDVNAYLRVRDNQDSFYLGTKNGIGYIGGQSDDDIVNLKIDLTTGASTFGGNITTSQTTDGGIIRITSEQNDPSHVTTTPFGSFEVYSEDGSGSGAGVRGAMRVYPSSTTGGSSRMAFDVDGTERFYIDNVGNATFSGNLTATSIGITNIVTNRIVKFNGSTLDDSSLLDTGTLITSSVPIEITGTLNVSSSVQASTFLMDSASGWLVKNTSGNHGLYFDGTETIVQSQGVFSIRANGTRIDLRNTYINGLLDVTGNVDIDSYLGVGIQSSSSYRIHAGGEIKVNAGNNLGFVLNGGNAIVRRDGTGMAIQTNSLDAIVIDNSQNVNMQGSASTVFDFTVGRDLIVTGEATWGNTRNHGNPRNLAIGYSGGNYGGFGYGLEYTSTSGTHNYAINDRVTRVDLDEGIVVYSAPTGTTGNPITWTETFRAIGRESTARFKGENLATQAWVNSNFAELSGEPNFGGTLTVKGSQESDAVIHLQADENDNGPDNWSIVSQASDNDFIIKSNTTEVFRLTDGSGNLTTAGDIEPGGTYRSSDGTAGYTGTVNLGSYELTIKDGIITNATFLG